MKKEKEKEKYKRMTKIIFMFKKHNNLNYSFKEKIVNSNDVNKFL